MQPGKTIESLQVIRGLATMLVVLIHGIGMMYIKANVPFPLKDFGFCYFSIDLFFVLSGFVIYYTTVTSRRPQTTKDFLIKRFVRVFPVYWLAAIIVLSLILYGEHKMHFLVTQTQTVQTLAVGGWSYLLHSFLLLPQIHPLIGVTWTLTYEVAFYLIFGLLFFTSRRWFFIVLSAWALTAVIVTLTGYNYGPNPWLNFLFNPVVAEIVYGCILAVIVTRVKIPRQFAYVCLTIGLIGFACMVTGWLKPSYFRIFSFGILASLVIFGSFYIERPMPRLLTYLGDASYSIYLYHIPVVSVLLKIFVLFGLSKYLTSGWLMVVNIGLALGVTCLIYQFIEKPLLSWLKTITKKSSKKIVSEPIQNTIG